MKATNFQNLFEFNIGDSVYLKTDINQDERLVIGYNIRPNGVIYVVALGESESYHYDFELTTEKDIIKSTSN